MAPSHLALLLFINALWGFNYIAGKVGTGEFGPLMFSTLRFAAVLLLLWPCLRIVGGQMGAVLLIGLCLGAGHYSFMFYALYLADNVSSIAIAAQLTVPFSTLFAIVFLNERIGWTRTLAITASFLGVVVIGFEPVNSTEQGLALLVACLAAAAMAVATILMRGLNGVGVFNLQAWVALVSVTSLALLTVVFEIESFIQLPGIPIHAYWAPVYSAVGATIIGHGSLYYLLQRYPVNQVAPFITLSTLFAIAWGVWLMDDSLTARVLIGGALTLLGVTVIAQRNAKSNTPSGVRLQR